MKTVKVFSHRGCNRQAPENSQIAFELAMSTGVEGFECDIQMTADGVPVLFHDDNFERLQLPGRISTHKWSELKHFDIAPLCPDYSESCVIMTLEQYLDEYFGIKTLLLEIKRVEDDSEEHQQNLINKVVEMVNSKAVNEPEAPFYLSCFNFTTLDYAYSLNENFNYIANSENIYTHDGISDLFSNRPWLKGVCLKKECINHAVTAEIHRMEKLAIMYTCNDSLTMQQMKECSVDIVISDCPMEL